MGLPGEPELSRRAEFHQGLKWLKLAAPCFGPALDDDFGLGKELDGMMALAVQVAEEAVFPAAEGKEGHGGGHADVDANIARFGLIAKLASRRPAVGK